MLFRTVCSSLIPTTTRAGIVLAASGLILVVSAMPSNALVLTLLSSEANVAGTLSDDDENWSDSDQSLDLDPSIQVSQSFSTNTSSNTFISSNHAPVVARLAISSLSSAGSGGPLSDSSSSHDFSIRFSIDEAAHYEFENGNSTGSFPRATASTAGTSASLVYELRREDTGTLVFSWSAPSSGSAGVYASGFVSAGTYVWTGVGAASANGDPCCGSQSASARGNVRLSFDTSFDAVPALSPLGGVGLVVALGVFGARRLRPA